MCPGERIFFPLIICKQVLCQSSILTIPSDAAVGSGCAGKHRLLNHLKFQRNFQKNLKPQSCPGRTGEMAWSHASPYLLHIPSVLSRYSIQHRSWVINSISPKPEHHLTSPSYSVLGFGLSLGLLMSD